MRPWLAGERSLERLNRLAAERGIHTQSGKPLRFVAPCAKDSYYEVKVFETGCVETRPESEHDFFNALAWLAFPRTKARINAMHAAEIPREGGRRGRLRDLLTILDEGGAIVQCDDPELLRLLRAGDWKHLFWTHRARVQTGMKVAVIGHAVLEKALEPWPGITSKVIVLPSGVDADAGAADWLARLAPGASPRDLPPLPIYGYPGWHPQNDSPKFYEDRRYFR